MTRRDFLLISGALRQAMDRTQSPSIRAGVAAAAYEMAEALGRGNQQFDKGRFLADAGVQQ
jgi:hypothetical protein